MWLCRDVYHCLPSALDGEDEYRLQEQVLCMNVEAELRRKREKARPKTRGRRGRKK